MAIKSLSDVPVVEIDPTILNAEQKALKVGDFVRFKNDPNYNKNVRGELLCNKVYKVIGYTTYDEYPNLSLEGRDDGGWWRGRFELAKDFLPGDHVLVKEADTDSAAHIKNKIVEVDYKEGDIVYVKNEFRSDRHIEQIGMLRSRFQHVGCDKPLTLSEPATKPFEKGEKAIILDFGPGYMGSLKVGQEVEISSDAGDDKVHIASVDAGGRNNHIWAFWKTPEKDATKYAGSLKRVAAKPEPVKMPESFKVGDYVRFVKSHAMPGKHPNLGKVFMVQSHDADNTYALRGFKNPPELTSAPWSKPDQLELATDFRPGDHVQVEPCEECSASCPCRPANKICKVREIASMGVALTRDGTLEITTDRNKIKHVGCDTPLTPLAPKPKYKVGELVRVKAVGKVFKIDGYDANNNYLLRGGSGPHTEDGLEPAGMIRLHDRVKMKGSCYAWREGDVATIDYVRNESVLGSNVYPGRDNGYYTFGNHYADLVACDEPLSTITPPKYKIGDLVRESGLVRKIACIHSTGPGKYHYDYSGVLGTDEAKLEPVGVVRVGDMVKIKKRVNSHLDTDPAWAVGAVAKVLKVRNNLGEITISKPATNWQTGVWIFDSEYDIVASDEPETFTKIANENHLYWNDATPTGPCSCGVEALKAEIATLDLASYREMKADRDRLDAGYIAARDACDALKRDLDRALDAAACSDEKYTQAMKQVEIMTEKLAEASNNLMLANGEIDMLKAKLPKAEPHRAGLPERFWTWAFAPTVEITERGVKTLLNPAGKIVAISRVEGAYDTECWRPTSRARMTVNRIASKTVAAAKWLWASRLVVFLYLAVLALGHGLRTRWKNAIEFHKEASRRENVSYLIGFSMMGLFLSIFVIIIPSLAIYDNVCESYEREAAKVEVKLGPSLSDPAQKLWYEKLQEDRARAARHAAGEKIVERPKFAWY